LLICAKGMHGGSIDLSSGADVLPTVLDLLGIEERTGDGDSLLRPRTNPLLPISAAGFPVWDRHIALVTQTRKLALVADPRWLDHYSVAGATDLDDHPVAPPSSPELSDELARFVARFNRFLR
jgi:hypothetical protein